MYDDMNMGGRARSRVGEHEGHGPGGGEATGGGGGTPPVREHAYCAAASWSLRPCLWPLPLCLCDLRLLTLEPPELQET